MAHYIHHVPGRLRVRNSLFKDNSPLLEEIRNCFTGAAGISGITANPLTGSVTVNYDPELLSPEKMVQIFEDCGYVDINRAATLDKELNQTFNKTGRYLGRAALGVVVDYALQGSGLSFLSALI